MKCLPIEVYETSVHGNRLAVRDDFFVAITESRVTLDPNITFQTITGFGGAFTQSSAYLLSKLSAKNSDGILKAYFSKEGANYTLTRTHMNSCDFSLSHYTYAPVANDPQLNHFSIEPDREYLIPMIKRAMALSDEGFKLIASPWTAAPWMKDNNDWIGGKLLPKYYETWALFFSKYISAYQKEGIPIWGFTVENEPHGNGNNWESMLFTPKEMTHFVQHHLAPKLLEDGYGDKVLLGYDQNRSGLKEWVDVLFGTTESAQYFDGTAIHWYDSTYEFFPKTLQYAHTKAPNKHLIQTEACVDAQVPAWKDDAWYWQKEATDWGWRWAPEEDKHLHPKYAPVHRYARDIIGCLNNWVDGWIDWNMVLDRQGGPNWCENWCTAPVIVDPEMDEVYYTPLYYVMGHFSKFIRPSAKVIDVSQEHSDLQVTAAKNEDGSLVVVVFNEYEVEKTFTLLLKDQSTNVQIPPQALQTIQITQNTTN